MRQKESLRFEVKLAMVRAAVEYKRTGRKRDSRSVLDPAGSGPFGFERVFSKESIGGFELRSPYDGRGFRKQVILSKTGFGPAFYRWKRGRGNLCRVI